MDTWKVDSLGSDVWPVHPAAVFCVKFKSAKSGKVFLNFGVCDELPPPKEINEDELASIIESDDPGSYRIPLSVSDPHVELDKSAETCNAVDVIINRSFYEKQVKGSELFKTFLVLVACEAVQNKHSSIRLNRDEWTALKNRKSVGHLQSQNIRSRPLRPLIQEIDPTTSAAPVKDTEVTEMSSRKKPVYKLVNKKLGSGKWGVEATIFLDGIESVDDITLDVGKNRIVMFAGNTYALDLTMPVEVVPDSVTSEFRTKDSKLLVFMPCVDV